MQIKENVTLYICEHCRKPYQVKSACINHELWCTHKPENIAKCSGCAFLQEIEKDIYRDGHNGEYTTTSKAFICSKLNVEVYPIKVSRLDLPNKYPEYFEGAIRMPSECEHFEYTW